MNTETIIIQLIHPILQFLSLYKFNNDSISLLVCSKLIHKTYFPHSVHLLDNVCTLKDNMKKNCVRRLHIEQLKDNVLNMFINLKEITFGPNFNDLLQIDFIPEG